MRTSLNILTPDNYDSICQEILNIAKLRLKLIIIIILTIIFYSFFKCLKIKLLLLLFI